MHDLRYRALAEIRKQPSCSNVQGIAINRVSDQHAENNWSLCRPPVRRYLSKAFCAAIMI
jgi:hypothetical protein